MIQAKQIYLPVSDVHIYMKHRRLTKYSEVLDCRGYDSETYQGKCKLLCDSQGNYVLNPSFYECLELMMLDENDESHRIFWNMDFDISAILKLYEQKNDKIERLLEGYTETFKNFEILYLRPKFLVIKKGKNRKVFTDMYYMYRLSLPKASKEYLNDKKFDKVDSKQLNDNLKYWNDNTDDIIKYCVQDCVLTRDLGNFLLLNVKKANLPIPKYLSSHASFSKEYFMRECKIASIKWIPENILDIACQTYFGGRFEILKRGYITYLIAYDINSAYPDTIAKLPSLKYGKWIKIYEGNKKEIIGFYKVKVLIPETRLSPFIMRFKGICMFPSGVFETWITWYEFDLLREYILEFEYGYEYIPSKREYYPFAQVIKNLYDMKSFYKYGSKHWKNGFIYRLYGLFENQKEQKNDVLSWIYKIFMNAIYGCFIERNTDVEKDEIVAGKLFNPVYATIITARTRWKLLKDVKPKNWKYLAGFHTDSVFSEKKLRELKKNRKLGNWSKEKEGKSILLMTGVYQIDKYSRNRGFSTKKDDKIKDNEQDKSIDWFEILKENADKDKIKFKRLKVMKSAESLKRFGNLDKVNLFTEYKKKLSINSDKKRDWNRDFKDCNDVLNGSIDSLAPKLKFIRNDDLK